jgi:hypothetical protein
MTKAGAIGTLDRAMELDVDEFAEQIEREVASDADGPEGPSNRDEPSPPRSHKRGKKRSPVWQHYETVEKGKHKCRLCSQIFQSATSTYSLRYHLEKEHPQAAMQTRVSRKRLAGEAFDQARFEDLLAQAIARNALPLRLVDDESFRAVLEYLQPRSRVPNRRRLTSTNLLALRERLEKAIRECIATVRHYSMSFDGWTSTANRQYLTVVFYGITKEWTLEVFEMDLIPVTAYSETGQYIADEVRDLMREWGLNEEALVAATTDSGANVKNAVRVRLGSEWIFCLAHALNLAVQSGLAIEEVQPILEKAKTITQFFRSSPKATRLLEEQQRRQEGLSVKKLKIDYRTRWNSALKMLKRLVASRPAISASLALSSGARRRVPEDLSGHEWALLNDLIMVLRPLKEATKFLSQQRNPTLAFALPIVARLLNHHLRQGDAEVDMRAAAPTVADRVRAAIRAGLESRWGEFIDERMPDAVLLAVYLDPRFKDFAFVNDAAMRERLVQRAFDAAARLLGEPGALLPSQSQQQLGADPNAAAAAEAQKRVADLFGERVFRARSSPNCRRTTGKRPALSLSRPPARTPTLAASATPWPGGRRATRSIRA